LFCAVLAEAVEMAADHGAFFVDGGLGGDDAGGEVAPDVAEEPGADECAAADHDAGAAGVFDHVAGVFGGSDVAVADDGDALDAGDDLGDAVEAGLTGEFHGGGAAVDGDEADADIFEAAREVGGDDGGVIPAEAEFAGEGRAEEAGFDLFDHAEGLVGVAEEFGAAVFLGDFVDGAAHVDVDDVGAAVFGPHGGFAEAVDVAAVELHAEGGIFGAGGGEFEGAFVFAEDAFGAEEVGGGHADAAAGTGDEAEGEVAVAGDGCEEEVGG